MKLKYFNLVALLFICYSCEEKILEPISESLGKPGQVSEVVSTPFAGGAVINYRIPNTEDILEVKAKYTITNGTTFEATASLYENKLILEGYNDTLEHEVKIYVYNRAYEKSEPYILKFRPLESAVNKVSKSLQIKSDFGGAQFKWINENRTPVYFELYSADSLGLMRLMRVFTTQQALGSQTLRGYKPVPTNFVAIIRDKWGNTSDSIKVNITPLFEKKFDKKIMQVMQLNNDPSMANYAGKPEFIIDDNLETFGETASGTLPASFTIDLGRRVKLSRFAMFQRKFENAYYDWGNVKDFEVWTYIGTAPTPSKSGVWSEWQKIMDTQIIKPSGTPGRTMTDEDLETALRGHDFPLDLDQAPMRYIRYVVKSSWENMSQCHPAELDFYGQDVVE